MRVYKYSIPIDDTLRRGRRDCVDRVNSLPIKELIVAAKLWKRYTESHLRDGSFCPSSPEEQRLLYAIESVARVQRKGR
jgi:hypothetical protein